MWPDRVSSPGPLTYETGALPTALRYVADSTVRKNRELLLTFALGMRLLNFT